MDIDRRDDAEQLHGHCPLSAANLLALTNRRRLVDAGWMWSPDGWLAPDDCDYDGKRWTFADAVQALGATAEAPR
jgi:hypothetical protein